MSSVIDRRRGIEPNVQLWTGAGWQLFVWNTDRWVKFGNPTHMTEVEVRRNIERSVKKGEAKPPIGYGPGVRRLAAPLHVYQPMNLWIVQEGRWVLFGEQMGWIEDARRKIQRLVRRGETPFAAYEGPANPGALVVYNGKKWSLLPRT